MESIEPADSQELKVTRRTRLVFNRDASAVSIAETLDKLGLPLAQKDEFALTYALEEAVFNALRATTEADRDESVIAEIEEDEGVLRVSVQDGAGGFDLSALPYDFTADPKDVDIASEDFDRYRERYDEQRFGLGLLTVRGLVEDFSLVFTDRNGDEVPWQGEGSVYGTLIRFQVRRGLLGEERRREPRYAVSGRAALADGPPAHIADLSLSGGRLIFTSRPAPRLDEIYPIRLVTEGEPAAEVNVWARVARAERIGNCYDIGVEFVDLNDEMRSGLANVIESVQQDASMEGMQGVQVEVNQPKDGS